MTIERISLLLSALVFGGFGFAFLIWPVALGGFVDIQLPTSTAITDFQATYGGLELGLAVFFAYCVISNRWVQPALLVQIVALGGLATARLIGVLQRGSVQPLIYWLLLAEVSGIVLGVWSPTHRFSSAPLGINYAPGRLSGFTFRSLNNHFPLTFSIVSS